MSAVLLALQGVSSWSPVFSGILTTGKSSTSVGLKQDGLGMQYGSMSPTRALFPHPSMSTNLSNRLIDRLVANTSIYDMLLDIECNVDPGQDWIDRVEVENDSAGTDVFTGASGSYSYIGGRAIWSWGTGSAAPWTIGSVQRQVRIFRGKPF